MDDQSQHESQLEEARNSKNKRISSLAEPAKSKGSSKAASKDQSEDAQEDQGEQEKGGNDNGAQDC